MATKDEIRKLFDQMKVWYSHRFEIKSNESQEDYTERVRSQLQDWYAHFKWVDFQLLGKAVILARIKISNGYVPSVGQIYTEVSKLAFGKIDDAEKSFAKIENVLRNNGYKASTYKKLEFIGLNEIEQLILTEDDFKRIGRTYSNTTQNWKYEKRDYIVLYKETQKQIEEKRLESILLRNDVLMISSENKYLLEESNENS